MKVFISWSGERSKRVAELLDGWLQCVIQAVTPWMSSKDIDRGALWFTEINDQLANTTVGIVCITKENRNKPWILFESGALAKGLSSNRVCTFLIDLVSTDLENPLAQFNHTLPSKEGVWSLVRTINSSLKDLALKEAVLERAFNTYWPQFDKDFQSILSSIPEVPVAETRKEPEILLEVLSAVRSLEKRMREIEYSNSKPFLGIIPKDSKYKYPDPEEVREAIQHYLNRSFTNAAILDAFEERKVPISKNILLEMIEQVKEARKAS